MTLTAVQSGIDSRAVPWRGGSGGITVRTGGTGANWRQDKRRTGGGSRWRMNRRLGGRPGRPGKGRCALGGTTVAGSAEAPCSMPPLAGRHWPRWPFRYLGGLSVMLDLAVLTASNLRMRAERRAAREWRNGRRAGFRCQCPKGRGGSNPPSRTQKGPRFSGGLSLFSLTPYFRRPNRRVGDQRPKPVHRDRRLGLNPGQRPQPQAQPAGSHSAMKPPSCSRPSGWLGR